MREVKIFDIPINGYASIKSMVKDIHNHGSGKVAVAINPEKVLYAISSKEMNSFIANADFKYLDGIGVVIVARLRGLKNAVRIPGCELWEELMRTSADFNKTVFLIGGSEGVVKDTENSLKKNYNVRVVGSHHGFFSDESKIIEEILRVEPDILTVAMGSPKQEIFIDKCRDAGVTAFMMGVGGTYDVYTNKVKRAPGFWRNNGLEWLYRLLSQPSRFFRQVKLLKFISLFLTGKI